MYTMNVNIKTAFISTFLLVLIDSIYLTYVGNYFNKQIQSIQSSPLKLNLRGALIAYIFLSIGLNYFIIQQREPWYNAFLLGIVIYGVYEGTNYAILKNWSLYTVILDTLWGGILFGLVTYYTYKLI